MQLCARPGCGHEDMAHTLNGCQATIDGRISACACAAYLPFPVRIKEERTFGVHPMANVDFSAIESRIVTREYLMAAGEAIRAGDVVTVSGRRSQDSLDAIGLALHSRPRRTTTIYHPNCRCTLYGVPQETEMQPSRLTLVNALARLQVVTKRRKTGEVRMPRELATEVTTIVTAFHEKLANEEAERLVANQQAQRGTFGDGSNFKKVRTWRITSQTVERKAKPGDPEYVEKSASMYNEPTQPTVVREVPPEDATGILTELAARVHALNAAGFKAVLTTDGLPGAATAPTTINLIIVND